MAEETSTFRWVVGTLIALLAAGGGIATLYNLFKPKDVNSNQTQSPSVYTSPTPMTNSTVMVETPKKECKVEGAVFNNQTNSPMPQVKVYLIDKNKKENYLATNGPDGKFMGDCSDFEPDSFPQRLKILTSNGFSWTDPDTVITSKGKSSINLWVSEVKDNTATIREIRVYKMRLPPTADTNMYQLDTNRTIRMNPLLVNRATKKD